MRRDNSADIIISSGKQKHISNIDENILQISSNNAAANNYGNNNSNSNSNGNAIINNNSKNNYSHQVNTTINNTNNIIHQKPSSESVNNYTTTNILNNLSNLENLIQSPKENKEKKFTCSTLNILKSKLELSSNQNFNPCYFNLGANTTKNKNNNNLTKLNSEGDLCNFDCNNYQNSFQNNNYNYQSENNANANTNTNANSSSKTNSHVNNHNYNVIN